jgi:hypothetical protein
MAKKRFYNPHHSDAGHHHAKHEKHHTIHMARHHSHPADTYEEAKRHEIEDGGMIREDEMQIANLPQEVMFKQYPKRDYYHYGLDDTIEGVDHQEEADIRGGTSKAKDKFPERY